MKLRIPDSGRPTVTATPPCGQSLARGRVQDATEGPWPATALRGRLGRPAGDRLTRRVTRPAGVPLRVTVGHSLCTESPGSQAASLIKAHLGYYYLVVVVLSHKFSLSLRT